jgi:hypothetical protein
MMPVLGLALLVCLTAAIRLAVLKPSDPPAASGAAVMAVGIFALGALQQMPPAIVSWTPLVAIGLVIVWVYIAAGIVRVWFEGRIRIYTAEPVGSFAIGTWVAGTAVVARLAYTSIPEWRIPAFGLGIAALAIWLWYLWLITPRFAVIGADPVGMRATGRILLSTVSTQSIVVLADILFPNQVPPWLLLGVIGLGCLFYVFGLLLIWRRYTRDNRWALPGDWDNTNCILHGAVSITGLASVLSRAVPDAVIVGIWVFAALMLVLVEGIELIRMLACIKMLGWRRGILKYNVSQWARNFTFGMFYIFTLRTQAIIPAQSEAALPPLTAIQDLVIAWGQYIVLVFLLVEIALFLAENIESRIQPVSARSTQTS